ATAGLADIRGGVTAAEELIQRGSGSAIDPAEIGLATSTTRCSGITATGTDAGAGEIECTLVGNPRVQGSVVTLTRDGSGQWDCSTDISEDKHKPAHCT